MNKFPLNEIITGCIGVCEGGRHIYFMKDDEVLQYKILSSTTSDTLHNFRSFYNADGICSHKDWEDLDIVQIYKPLEVKTDTDTLQAELLWEREVDWANVPVDTPILVKLNGSTTWTKRHFAYYYDGKVYAYDNGMTSFTCSSISVTKWDKAKLAKENK